MGLASMPSASHWPHGVRARYVAGCRCQECRDATARYERERKLRAPNPLVPSGPVRAHLRTLSAQGVGRRAVQAATDVPDSTLGYVISGRRSQLRKATAEKILAVDAQAIADGALVDAAETWRLLRELISEGYRRYDIAKRLGCEAKVPKLQVRDGKVQASTALRVKKLHAALLAESSDDANIPAPHEYESPRFRIVRALRFFDWVTAEDLFFGMELDETERFNYAQVIHRLARSRVIERRGTGFPYEYRSAK